MLDGTLTVPLTSDERDNGIELLHEINADSEGKFNTHRIKLPSACFVESRSKNMFLDGNERE